MHGKHDNNTRDNLKARAAWHRPAIQRIDIKRTLAKTGSQFDGGSSTPASKLP